MEETLKMIDIHTHLLPGVDDGAKTMEEALALLREEYAQGVGVVVLTPHYRIGMFEPKMSAIRERFHALKEEAKAAGIPVRLLLGCEFHATMDMVELLDAQKRPTLGDTPYVLVEFSGGDTKTFIRERCSTLSRAGYRPVIAHVERVNAFRKDERLLEELVYSGVLAQMNAAPILGKEGLGTKLWCGRMIRRHLISVVASDVHNEKKRACHMAKCREYLIRKYGREVAEELLCPEWVVGK